MNYKFQILALFILFTANVKAQNPSTEPIRYTASNKGKIYFYWGGNRANYTNSDIRFKGENYDFTLENVKAKDVPKGWHIDYINPARMTIPQTNFRLGYFISDHYNISFGIDHMKYVMRQNQEVSYKGYYPNQGSYGEVAADGKLLLTEDFLTFEHTDGLNYVNLEINRFDDISRLFGIQNTDKIQINITEGVGTGVLYPKTNTKLLGKERYDQFHVSGLGISAKAGLNITLFKHFFVQTELKGGYINMSDVRTSSDRKDRASHDFFFAETIIVFGGIFKL